MIPDYSADFAAAHAVPRTRGDDPDQSSVLLLLVNLFPAHAGMILLRSFSKKSNAAVPRTRGDDPSTDNVRSK